MKRLARQFAIYWAPLLLWMGVIYVWSSLSIETIESLEPGDGTTPFSFAIVHFAEFALLSALAYWAFRSPNRLSLPALWGAVLLFTLLYALSDEIHQSFTPGRSASYTDFAVDLLGGVTGLVTADSLLEWFLPQRFITNNQPQNNDTETPSE